MIELEPYENKHGPPIFVILPGYKLSNSSYKVGLDFLSATLTGQDPLLTTNLQVSGVQSSIRISCLGH